MAIVKPFKGLKPPKEIAKDLACLPYDVMNAEEIIRYVSMEIQNAEI